MPTNRKQLSRRDFLRGMSATGAGGLVVGGAAGYFGGQAGQTSAATTASTTGKSTPILVGSGVPVTGSYSGDGQQMLRGQKLAVADINAAGGVLGRPIQLHVLDTKTQQPDVMKSVFQKFVSLNAAAVFSPFCTYSSVEFPIVAQANIPTFHVNTWHGNVDFVKAHGYKNIFQGDPSETWYGPGFAVLVDDLIANNQWTPKAKTIAVVTSNDPYSLNISKTFQATMTKKGWKTTLFEQFTAPQADWTATLVKIRNSPPGILFFSDYAAGDEASFIKQFRQSPTPSLVYQQYAPSIPQYLELAKGAANGVVWSTVVGILEDDPVAKPFDQKFRQRFHASAGFSNAGDQYDLMHIWANAASEADDPYDFAKVNANVKATIHRGVCGAYSWPDDYLTCYPYPDYTKDPSLGMPHLTFQIQNGKQVLISPKPYTTGRFQTPPWLTA